MWRALLVDENKNEEPVGASPGPAIIPYPRPGGIARQLPIDDPQPSKRDEGMANPSIEELFSLKGKVALITGGAGWVGTALSEALAQAGATVVIADIDREALDKVTSEMKKRGSPVIGLDADMMQDKSIRECIDGVAADCGRLDVLINCAYRGPSPTIDDATFDDYSEGFLHPSSYAIAAQQAAVHMRKVGGGSIVNIGSMYGQVTGYPKVYEGLTKPNPITYQAGKAAVLHMTRHMAVYWAKDNIRANCISPGPFPSLSQQAVPSFVDRLNEKVPLGRIGAPWELKGAVVFLASEASGYITGQNIAVDGGWTVW